MFGRRRGPEDVRPAVDRRDEHARVEGEGFECTCGLRSRDAALLALHFARIRRGVAEDVARTGVT
jgi:hypothetical protein